MLGSVLQFMIALSRVALDLLDPTLQMANGVDLYYEATRSAPLEVMRVILNPFLCNHEGSPLRPCVLRRSLRASGAARSAVPCPTASSTAHRAPSLRAPARWTAAPTEGPWSTTPHHSGVFLLPPLSSEE